MSRIALGDEIAPPPALEPAPPRVPWDLARIMFAVVGIGGLIAASFLVLQPFLPAVIWATMIVVATWPTMRMVQARLWGRRSLAVLVMTLVLLASLALPLTMGTLAIVERADDVVAWARSLISRPLPPLPGWLTAVPFVGAKLGAEWSKIASAPSDELAARVMPHVREVARWLITQAGSVGALLLQFLLTVGVSAILYAKGEAVAAGVQAFANRLAGSHGVRAVLLSAGAIRAVALGIVVTAAVQALIGGIGLAVSGVPHAVLLTCVMLMLGVAQIGWQYARRQPIGSLQLLSVVLILASGTATFFTRDPTFVMLKPSVIYCIVGVVMLKRGWMNRYLPERAQPVADVATAFGYAWAGLMFASAALNIALALTLDAKTWAAVMSGWGLFSKIGLFLIQYGWMTAIGRRRAAAAA